MVPMIGRGNVQARGGRVSNTDTAAMLAQSKRQSFAEKRDKMVVGKVLLFFSLVVQNCCHTSMLQVGV